MQHAAPHDAAALQQEGDAHLAAKRYGPAVESYERAASLFEVPPGDLSAKLARASLALGHHAEASAWALRVVDGGDSFKAWTAAAQVLDRCPPDTIPGIRHRSTIGVVGTWTTKAFVPLFRLAAARLGLATTVYEAGFGQYFNETLDPNSTLHGQKADALVLCPDHRTLGLPAWSDEPREVVDAAVERWSGVWSAIRGIAPTTIIQHGFAVPGSDPLGHYASGLDGSRRKLAAEVNARLAAMANERDIAFLDTDLLAARTGKERWFDDRGWYMAKVACAPAAMTALARHTAALLAAKLGFSRRCLVLDLDNTLWGGVVADDGVAGIRLGGGIEGEAYVDFQTAIKELANRGIILAVCSKNDRSVAEEPFKMHPEMVLTLDDIAAFVANWEPKSVNIAEVARRLGIGLDAITFLDDNPYERAEVRRALPAVDVPLLPPDATGFRAALEVYPYFEPAAFTAADAKRTEQYRARARAEEARLSAGSLEEYQASLNMVARFGPIDQVNMARVVQLINKTNQFNLTTRRRNQAQLEEFLSRTGSRHFWVRLRDKFADHGLIAVALATVDREVMEIDTLLMSCRVIGRGVEELIVRELAAIAVEAGCNRLLGVYIPTERNGMVAELYPRLGFVSSATLGGEHETWIASPRDLWSQKSHIDVEHATSQIGAQA